MTEFYIAFSKHNTYTFISARKDFPGLKRDNYNFTLDGIDFARAYSRTSSLRNAVKLNYAGIRDTTLPKDVFAFFNRLRELNWIIDDAAYIALNKLPAYVKAAPVLENPPVTETPANLPTVTLPSASENNTPVETSQETAATNTEVEVTNNPTVQTEMPIPATVAPVAQKQNQELGGMQKTLMALIEGAVSFAELAKKAGESLSKKFSPSDIKRSVLGMEKKGLVKVEEDKVTKL